MLSIHPHVTRCVDTTDPVKRSGAFSEIDRLCDLLGQTQGQRRLTIARNQQPVVVKMWLRKTRATN